MCVDIHIYIISVKYETIKLKKNKEWNIGRFSIFLYSCLMVYPMKTLSLNNNLLFHTSSTVQYYFCHQGILLLTKLNTSWNIQFVLKINWPGRHFQALVSRVLELEELVTGLTKIFMFYSIYWTLTEYGCPYVNYIQ